MPDTKQNVNQESIKYKALNAYTKAYLMAVLTKDGIKIERRPIVGSGAFGNPIHIIVKYNGTPVYTYIMGQRGHSIVVDGNVVAEMPTPINNDMQDILGLLLGAGIFRKRKEMRLEDIRATAYISKVFQNQK